jgi:predicted lipase
VSVIAGDRYQLQAVVAYSELENGIIISVRGSVLNIENWVQNLDFFKTNPFPEYPDAGVHEGFYNSWQSIRDPVLAAVQNLKNAHGVNTVYATGHSLGGAIAHHAAFDLSLHHGFETVVFSYGAPRTGDLEWAQAVSERVSKIHRITHNKDIVPHAPFQIMGFYHVTTEIFFSDGLNWRLCDGTGEDPSCSNDCGILGCASVPDHLKYLDIDIGKDIGDGYQCSGSSVVV